MICDVKHLIQEVVALSSKNVRMIIRLSSGPSLARRNGRLKVAVQTMIISHAKGWLVQKPKSKPSPSRSEHSEEGGCLFAVLNY